MYSAKYASSKGALSPTLMPGNEHQAILKCFYAIFVSSSSYGYLNHVSDLTEGRFD